MGQITAINQWKVTVDNGDTVFEHSKGDGTVFVVGDWVSMFIAHDPEESRKNVIRVEPLRKWKFEGRVTFVDQKEGIVDETVYFRLSVCQNGYYTNLYQ